MLQSALIPTVCVLALSHLCDTLTLKPYDVSENTLYLPLIFTNCCILRDIIKGVALASHK